MPDLQRKPLLDEISVRSYLQSALPDPLFIDTDNGVEQGKLFLLQTTHMVAAFGFPNGDVRQSYDSLYARFKDCYSKRRNDWENFDLAFVLCVQSVGSNIEQFCSEIETDVYFCRKFVVLPSFSLGNSLARLPFLPLSPLDGPPIRPPPAQTLLRQSDMPAALARGIVMPNARSAEGIVDDCMSGKYGEFLEVKSATNAKTASSERVFEPVQLESVTIKNFRAYRKSQSFAIGADVTVLYGPNGFGKTSFFDAVDFAVTGGLARIESSNEDRFAKTAAHLDSKGEESAVSLILRRNQGTHVVTRRVRERKLASFDGVDTDRKALLAELTGGNTPIADRVENLVSLFRATHLFSQEQQELTRNFQNDSSLPVSIVSRMLAFEDYSNALGKVADVLKILRHSLSKGIAEIETLASQIKGEKGELERLSKSSQGHIDPALLENELDSFTKRLELLGISSPSQKADVSTMRSWRASLEARHAEGESRLRRLAVLNREITELPRIRTEFAGHTNRLTEAIRALEGVEKRRINAEAEAQAIDLTIGRLKVKGKEIQNQAEEVRWVKITKPSYSQLLVVRKSLEDEIAQLTEALANERALEFKAVNDLKNQEILGSRLQDLLVSKRSDLAAGRKLEESIADWQAVQTRLLELDELEAKLLRSLDALQSEEKDLNSKTSNIKAEEIRLAQQVQYVDRNQSDLKKLLSQLQNHVQSGTCPLCGEEHGSKEILEKKIQQHLLRDAASVSRSELTKLREASHQISEKSAANKKARQIEEDRASTLKKDRAVLLDAHGRFSDSVLKLGIVIDPSSPNIFEALRLRLDEFETEVASTSRQIEESNARVGAMARALEDAKVKVTLKASVVSERQAALARAQEQIQTLRNDSRQSRVPFETKDEELIRLDRSSEGALIDVELESAKLQAVLAQKRAEVSALVQERNSLRAQVSNLQGQTAQLLKAETEIVARLEEAKLPDATMATVLGSITDEARSQAQLLALKESASNLELAIDSATTAAALSTLLKNIRDKEIAIKQVTEDRDRQATWLRYFEEISRLLSTQQDGAVENFTREYGPRTSVIQRRLRSVYGFDDIEVRSQDSAISVRVKRHSEALRPIDYFSQSQQQTLLLGLFLTACSSQSWSAFSPVFLDDPITHFDDLNTYSFLDLIVGLLESDFGKRQFVISTCDEKFLLLARQKFRHLGSRAKFHRFSAIGADGPVVEEIYLSESQHESVPQ